MCTTRLPIRPNARLLRVSNRFHLVSSRSCCRLQRGASLTVRSGESAAALRSASGAAFLPAYAILSAVAAFGIMVAGRYGGSRIGVALGLVLPTIVVPGCMWLLMRRSSGGRWRARTRRSRRQVTDRKPRSIRREAQSIHREPQNVPRQSRRRGRPERQGHRRIAAVPALVAVVWCGVTGAALVPVILAFVESWQAQRHFAEAKGLVLESRLKEERGSDSIDYRPVVIYQYDIDGKVYRNDRIMFGTIRVSRSQDEAEIASPAISPEWDAASLLQPGRPPTGSARHGRGARIRPAGLCHVCVCNCRRLHGSRDLLSVRSRCIMSGSSESSRQRSRRTSVPTCSRLWLWDFSPGFTQGTMLCGCGSELA